MHKDRMTRMFGKDWKPELPKTTQSDDYEGKAEDDSVMEIDYPINNTGLFNGDNEITNKKT